MKNRKEIYSSRLTSFESKLRKAKRLSSRIVLLRVVGFVVGAVLSYYLYDVHALACIAGIVATLAVFLFLVKRHAEFRQLIEFNKAIIELNKAELRALEGDISYFDDGKQFAPGDHEFSHDLDLLGDRSIYQWLNRSVTHEGKRLLADELLNPTLGSEVIRDKQKAIAELGEGFEWRQEFYAHGKVNATILAEKGEVRKWLDNRSTFTRQTWVKVIKVLLPLTSFVGIVLFGLGVLSFLQLLLVLSVPLLFAGIKVKETNKQHALADKYRAAMQQQGRLLEMVENRPFEAEYLKRRLEALEVEGEGAGASLQKLTAIVGALDNRANPFVGIGLNAVLLWDFQVMSRLEGWLDAHGPKLEQWIDIVAEFDCLMSYAHIAWNHPEYAWPEVTEDVVLSAKDIGHPLLPKENRVDNDFRINDQGEFVIITGANMAGKSTFLRTIGVNLVLARCGAPVCAVAMKFKPLKLFTSMRTTDSLQENESYFYTELKRLNRIVDLQNQGHELFIILDEILKGTNSKDKAQGSKRFVEKLVKLRSTGIIATHDLSLCELAGTMKSVRNQCFEVEFGKDDLIFDYKLRDGVCQNMNATWLMEKMNIV